MALFSNNKNITKKYITNENLNNRLAELESIYEKKIMIQLHPNTKERKQIDYLKRFELVTDNLTSNIYNASFILSHDSTSLGLVTYLNKNFCLLISRSFTVDLNNDVFKYAVELDANVHLMEDKFVKPINFKSKSLIRKKYLDNYVKHPKSKEKIIWEEIYDHFCENNKNIY